jgi:polyribonucleotide nucleotidyltransferase
MRDAYAITDKLERQNAVAAAKEAIKETLTEEQLEDANLGSALKKLESTVLRSDVVKNGRRIDGRALDEVRPIDCPDLGPAPDPRLGAVHPWRDAGPCRDNAGHRRR